MHSTQLITGLKKEKDSVPRLTSLWMCCVACVLLKRQEGATKGQLFSCPLVISIGQKAAGGRDALRKQSHVMSCMAAETRTHTLILYCWRTALCYIRSCFFGSLSSMESAHRRSGLSGNQCETGWQVYMWATKFPLFHPDFPWTHSKLRFFPVLQFILSKTFKTVILDLVH